jgi:hypothetical protein
MILQLTEVAVPKEALKLLTPPAIIDDIAHDINTIQRS